jgi:hypothetical protein
MAAALEMDRDAEIERLRRCESPEEICDAIRRHFGLSLQSIRICAAGVLRLTELGESLPTEVEFVAPYLLKIGQGRMLEQLLIKHYGCLDLLKRTSSLPKREQERIASDTPLPVIAEGAVVERRPSELNGKYRKQLFGAGTIRSIDEQRKYLALRPAIPSVPAYVIDRKAREAVFTRPCRLNISAIESLLKELKILAAAH